ncbi:DUF6531 domain-containing protein [Massilia sp. IC2-278]|uniref:DUF6531 domain-containing protein n=1 Tax=Massilia sp. IC2-278 TaxID=2887200 RepID=UPI001E489C35|nr:RHS repeat-associated core domain-containing protein [Massilia sp. IC2-278]MCC2961292.1 DUF6531 domain-containing protein [Massilia sp. IC2-278]
MSTPWFRPAALSCVFAWLGAMSGSAVAQLPPIGIPGTPACPPNSSCVPSLPPVSPPGTCGPGNGGATCGGAGPAAMGSSTGVNVGAGNPINVINGNKYQREVDMAPLPGTLGLEIIRHYNSSHSKAGSSTNLVGRGWKLSYETDLYVSGRTVQIVQADGSRIIFNRDPRDPSLCASADPANGTVSIGKTGRGEEYTWRWADGRQLNFDSKGKLVQILAPNGQFVSLQHDARGLLVSVTDPQGRRLQLQYLDKAQSAAGTAFRGVQSIVSPVGTFRYRYGSPAPKGAQVPANTLLANLVKVEMPTGARYYHYESSSFPTYLTGISELASDAQGKAAWQRVSTYGYDDNGRGNLSVKGYPARLARDAGGKVLQPARLVAGTGVQQITLEHGTGMTTLTNSLGQKTVYRHAIIAGEYRLLEARGAGCVTCSDTNVRYGYDAQGRLTTVTTLDVNGTPLAAKVTTLDSLGRAVRVEKIGYQHGKAGARQFQLRFEYLGNASEPTLVARPSVVPGKELVTRYQYDQRGLLSAVSEHGFAPTTDGLHAAMPIERTISYRYNAYGDQTEIAGPLANATSEDHLTRIEYDPKSKLPKRFTGPGNITTEVVERDAALRPRVLRWQDGATVRTTTIRNDWRGQPLELQVTQGTVTQVERYRYDLNGHLRERILSDGTRITAATAAAPAEPQLSGLPAQRDWAGRPVAWSDSAGQALQADWGASGTAAQASVVALESAHRKALRVIDDFGRVTAIRNPGQGWQLARYDAAGRLLETVDPRGARQVARWDAAGRLLETRRFAPGATAAEQTVRYRYRGMLLTEQSIEDADGTRKTLNDYDEGGRLLRETLRIEASGKLAAALPRALEMHQGWRYDGHGRVAGHTLTDATGATHEFAQRFDAQGMPGAIHTVGMLPAALGGQRKIVSAITWQVVQGSPFATEIAHADGTVDRYAPALESGAGAGVQQLAGTAEPAAAGARSADAAAFLSGSPGQQVDDAGLPAAFASQRLHWNAAGQLVQAVRPNGSSRYIYDARGRRVVKLVSGAGGPDRVTLTMYDGTRLLAEADADGRAQFAYAYLGWRPLAQIDLRKRSWWAGLRTWLFGAPARALHTDRAGKVRSMTAAGQTVWEDAGPVSLPRVLRTAASAAAGVHQPLRYIGQYHDEESGLSYHGARFFDPASERFLSPDPAGVADAVDDLPAPMLLDLYAYAGGRPDEFFDPDGAARIRYFLITTGANGNALGTNKGFVKARWAFIVDNIQTGLPASALGQKQNEYAQNGTSLLVDAKGNFFSGSTAAATWTNGASQEDAFKQHYGNKLISLPQFTVEMDDAKATQLIATYIATDRQALFPTNCPARIGLLPDIPFAPEEVPIKVGSADYKNANGKVLAQSQRIVECGASSATNIADRRLQKYNYAAMLLETYPPQINKDCSADGCPGKNLVATVLPDYIASYGTTQIIGTTMVENLRAIKNSSTMTDAAGRLALQLDNAVLWEAVERQQTRAIYAAQQFSAHTASTPDWDAATQAQRTAFMNGTGLAAAAAKQLWNDINRWKRNPTARFNGEARAAIATTVLLSDPTVNTYLMGIYKDSLPGGRLSIVSMALMRKSYNSVRGQVNVTNDYPPLVNGQPNPAWVKRQREIELQLAMRTAREHNGDGGNHAKSGSFAAMLEYDRTAGGGQYAHRFVNAFEYPVTQPADPRRQQPVADYFALRCTSDLPDTVPRGGLDITPLVLP